MVVCEPRGRMKPAEPTTEELLIRIRAHDEDALLALYDRLGPVLRGIAVRILSSAEDAEEIVEQAFLELWNRTECEYQPEASVRAQLVLHIRKLGVRRLRQTRNLQPLPSTELGAALSRYLPQPDEVAQVDSRQELLRRILGHLPAVQRRVLDLSILEGYSEEEMAHALNQPLGRVRDELRASLSFARQRLQTLMGTWTADI